MTVLNKSKPYAIDYRVLQDQDWFLGNLHVNLIPEWTNWKVYGEYSTLEKLNESMLKLEKEKKMFTYTVDYRCIKK